MCTIKSECPFEISNSLRLNTKIHVHKRKFAFQLAFVRSKMHSDEPKMAHATFTFAIENGRNPQNKLKVI